MTIRSTEPGHFRAATAEGACEDRRIAAVFVLADHGMGLADPRMQGHHRPSLDATGVASGDLDDGLSYLS